MQTPLFENERGEGGIEKEISLEEEIQENIKNNILAAVGLQYRYIDRNIPISHSIFVFQSSREVVIRSRNK